MKIKSIQNLGNEGFTLIEALAAIVVFTIGILAFFTMQTTVIKGNSTASGVTTAATWAADRIEILLATDFDDVEDTNNNGTGQDLNYDGVDDDGGNFGLDDNTVASADGNATSPDGVYTILWNVADYLTPVPGSDESYVKALRIIVLRNDAGFQKQTVLNYYIQKTF